MVTILVRCVRIGTLSDQVGQELQITGSGGRPQERLGTLRRNRRVNWNRRRRGQYRHYRDSELRHTTRVSWAGKARGHYDDMTTGASFP
jgi:hypothetical protein